MTMNEKFLCAVAKHMPQVNCERLRRRLAPLDINARYTAACFALDDARLCGSGAAIVAAQAKMAEVSNERNMILRS